MHASWVVLSSAVQSKIQDTLLWSEEEPSKANHDTLSHHLLDAKNCVYHFDSIYDKDSVCRHHYSDVLVPGDISSHLDRVTMGGQTRQFLARCQWNRSLHRFATSSDLLWTDSSLSKCRSTGMDADLFYPSDTCLQYLYHNLHVNLLHKTTVSQG